MIGTKTPQEKKWWGGLIATGSQREGLSRNPRAEIWLRKLQRRTVGVTEYVDAASEGFPMTAEEVVEAYEEGLLVSNVWAPADLKAHLLI